ncbi:F-box/kelch-repeat protein At3g23880-like [Neltuma alba]|uniref:F-box/kelch-repeat protein At3g23880-like n=1 Tax=Neltuma alba TaxID=207710 RepID=UPI0010A5931D|nr:F-box/kelch-repeat protein At3g23880-like [Prosopis alba]
MRFQCVCKHWKNLINDPSFIQDHLRHSSHQNPSIFIGESGGDDPFRLYLLNCKMQFREFDKAPFVGPLVGVCLVGSCNGLLCLADYNIRPPAPLLWNPATRDIRQIPITFNDSRMVWNFGFGFSPVINDYKIVRFSSHRLDFVVCEVEVYSLSTGAWKSIQFDNIKDVCLLGHGVNVNGVMFWEGRKHVEEMDSDEAESEDIEDPYVIVSFDMVSETFTVVPSPTSCYKLAVTEDKLAIISPSEIKDSQDSCIYFRVLGEGAIGSSGEKWSSREYILNYPFKLHDLRAGAILRDQIVWIDFALPRSKKLRMEDAEHLYLINLTTDERKLLSFPRLEPGYGVSDFRYVKRPGFGIFNYVESLVPVDNIQIEES